EKLCEDYNIKYAFIGCSIGSLQKSTFMYLVPKSKAKVKAELSPLELPGPIEFLGGFGIVCEDSNGKRSIHLHGVISDKLGCTYGGHFVKGQNPVLVTIDLILIEVKGMKLLRKYDKETEAIVFAPEPI
ncbi:MAG: DNA-binding protein, partial [Candidatus Bathyarchaeia archaeon]